MSYQSIWPAKTSSTANIRHSFIKWKPNICVKIKQEEINLSKCLQDNSQCKTLFFGKYGNIVISLCSKNIFKKKLLLVAFKIL